MGQSIEIQRLPRAFDADLGQDALALVPALHGDQARLVAGAAGSSPYLKELISREADWLARALTDPQTALAGIFADVRALAPDQLKPGLRRAKRQLALLSGLCDLAGAWDLMQVTTALTQFAELCTYTNKRAQDHRAIIELTDSLVTLFSNDLLPLVAGRNIGLKVLNYLPVLENALVKKTMGY